MINIDTLRFLDLLNEFAALCENGGIKPFSKVTPEEDAEARGLYFDDKNPYKDKLLDDSINEYPLIADMCIDRIHHDIISTYRPIPKMGIKQIAIGEFEDEDGSYYELNIHLEDNDGKTEVVIIKDGYWELPGGSFDMYDYD